MIGKSLLHYEIEESIGKGGMGEVFRARDTKLGRDVALKVLPAELSGDPEREARFQREARALASLQHPNVASIYGFEEAEGDPLPGDGAGEGADLTRPHQGRPGRAWTRRCPSRGRSPRAWRRPTRTASSTAT